MEYKPVVKRVIHTTADFSYETSMMFSDGVIEKALMAIREGTEIVTDTNMAKSGINHKMAEKFGCSLNCYMADEGVAKEAASREITRAVVSVEKAAKRYSIYSCKRQKRRKQCCSGNYERIVLYGSR